MKKMTLTKNWIMKKTGDNTSYDVIIPTTMYQVLLENNVIADPFIGENDRHLTSLSDDDYEFSCTFQVSKDLLEEKYMDLEFLGLDTLADIYLNGKLIGATNNMHRTYRFSIKDKVKQGENQLEVHFHSPTHFIKNAQRKDPLWGISTTLDGYEHLRKAHHMFGWDWGPQLPDMGIWRPVSLMAYSEGKIEDIHITQLHEENKVCLKTDLRLNEQGKDLTLEVNILDPEGKTIITESIPIENTLSSMEWIIKEPQLWWPAGYGDQPLYTVNLAIYQGNLLLDEDSKRIGLRTFTVVREPDSWGETFDFEINGLRIFAMGANYIPQDALITRKTEQDTLQLIKDCVKANHNCIRVWGGAYYPDDSFYDTCDEYGLIVWQDFMFACGVYRLTKSFEENIRQEFIDNIKRLRHHPSLGIWCGNNEMEQGLTEWGIPNDERLKLDYLLMYEKLIPDVLEEYDPYTFYWPASPSSGGGFLEPNADHKGDVHYWAVFHGNEHYKKFRDHYFRFASEYGMQSFPNMKTVNRYASKEEQNIFGPVMENHNKCIEPMNGNVKILLNMTQEFKLPSNTEDIVYISQVFQGETIKCAVEHFRRNRGRCMGSTYWQLNDNYPAASWSSIDVYGRWKGLHYFSKRFYNPLLLSAYEEGFNGHIHFTNDQTSTFDGKVKWEIHHVLDGLLEEKTMAISCDPLKAMHVTDVSIEKWLKGMDDERNLYLAFHLFDNDDQLISSDTLLFTYHKYFHFQPGSIETIFQQNGDHMEIRLISDRFMKSVALDFQEDVILSDNFFDLLPGQEKVVIIEEILGSNETDTNQLEKTLKIQTVNDIQ